MNCYHLINKNSEEKCLHTVINGVTDNIFHTVWDNIRFHVQENIFMNIQRNIKSMFLSTKPENLYFMVYNSEHEYNPKKPSKKQFDNAYKLLETI
jgi:ssDNA-specific exonuclease RecJ